MCCLSCFSPLGRTVNLLSPPPAALIPATRNQDSCLVARSIHRLFSGKIRSMRTMWIVEKECMRSPPPPLSVGGGMPCPRSFRRSNFEDGGFHEGGGGGRLGGIGRFY